MAFRFRCPKCNGTSFSIERDSRSYAARGQMHEMIFSCRCGTQLYGDSIEQEYMRQKSEWETTAADRRTRRPPPRATGADDGAYERERADRARRVEAEAEAKQVRQKEEDRQWRERSANQPESEGSGVAAGSTSCEWKDCENPARPNSKYCSRDCSNKNARSRYKRRKGGKEAA